jgi:hypothetical protein
VPLRKRTGKTTEWDISHFLAYADDLNIVGENTDTTQKNTEALLNTRFSGKKSK